MDRTAFINSLVEYADQLDDVEPLETQRDALFARMQSEGGKTLVNTNATGKAFGFQVNATLEELFGAYVAAIKIFNDAAGSSPVTFIDFSQANGSAGAPPCNPLCP
ncbi:MAG TPA: hypothetical protein VHW03_04485 [Chthoniobacterales bacterium]|jgi:hypothetical protein|nr:hypothetical protein [Chthoniobacterales bacterium]